MCVGVPDTLLHIAIVLMGIKNQNKTKKKKQSKQNNKNNINSNTKTKSSKQIAYSICSENLWSYSHLQFSKLSHWNFALTERY